MKHVLRSLMAASVIAAPSLALATPLYDYFGALNEANFGGTGIPNTDVAVASQFEDGTNLITVALTATARYANPTVTNDGAGTFFATPGANTLGAPGGAPLGATWNFNYFIKVESTNGGSPKITDYDIKLLYDFDPTFDNGPTGLGVIDVSAIVAAGLNTPSNTLSALEQGSQNLLFSFLGAPGSPPFIISPTANGVLAFNPNALGEYNFAIQVSKAGWGVENVRMDVQVVPVPAAAWLFGGALGLLGWARRKIA